jgi:DNA polymerase-3 subunit delta'
MATAMVLNCLKPVGTSACGVCRSCKKVISGNHPDVIIVKPSGTFIKIDQVRSLRKTLRFAPLEGGRRVIIINDAHAMNLEASNAMLKILEEPPNDTYIIITASRTTDLLPTIVSRCQQIPFRPVAVADIAAALGTRSGLDADAATAVAVLAKGSLGRALSADAEKWMDWRNDLLERVELVSSESTHALFVFADRLARDKDRLQDALDVIIIWFRDILICRFHPEKILNRDCMEEIQRKSEQLSVDDILEIIMAVFAAQRAIVKNANRRLSLEVMMMRISSTFRKSLHPQGY